MSRTDLSAANLAKSLRTKAGDGSVEWCYEPMQVSVMLDIADMLDENAKLRELAREAVAMAREFYNLGGTYNDLDELLYEASELGIEVDE